MGMTAWWRRLREALETLFRKDRVARELDEELAFHVERETARLVEGGMDLLAARREANRRIGGVERTRERTREERSGRLLDDLVQDVRYGLRTLARSPGYALVALVTLGLGIGAETAVFSLVSGVLLDPLPYAHGDRLVYLRQSLDAGETHFSVLDIQDLRSGLHTLEDVVEYHAMSFTLLGDGEPEEVTTGVVSYNFFRALGTEPILGRDFIAADDALGAPPVLILSNGYWLRRFGGDPSVVGRAFEMNGKMHTVVGVLPPVPQFPNENDVYMPTSACPIRSSESFRETRDARMMSVFGRMHDGVTVDQVAADVGTVERHLEAAHPADYPVDRGHRVTVSPLKEELVQGARPTLLVLLGTAAFVLLIACANVANLGLSRLMRRQEELAVRAAVGAGQGRLARQLLTESTLLALAGGLLGLGVAHAGLHVLVDFAARFTPRAEEAAIDGPVLAFALLASLVTGVVFGALPALRARSGLSDALRGATSSHGPGAARVQDGLVVAQMALAVVLMVGAGLLVRSFVALQSVDPGYDPSHVLAMQVTVNNRNTDWSEARMKRFYLDLLDRLRALPGVEAAGVTSSVPMVAAAGFPSALRVPEAADVPVGRLPQAEVRVASPGFFSAVGMRLVEGRFLDATDREGGPQAVVINASLARRLWPGQSAMGRTFVGCGLRSGQCDDAPVTVVGVFADVRQHGLDEDAPDQVYVSSLQQAFPGIHVVVRTAGDPLAMAGTFADVVHELAPTVPVSNVRTLASIVDDRLAPRKLTMILLGLFAGLALLVSLTGVGGMLAFAVSRRTREIGLRMVLGADRGGVQGMVLGQGLRLVGLGLALGVVASLGLGRLMRGLVYGVAPTDPLTYASVAGAVVAVAALACWIPARRASRVDPATVLREA